METAVSVQTLLGILAVIVIPCIAFAVGTIIKVAKLEVKVDIYKQIAEQKSDSYDEKICEVEKKMEDGFKSIHADLRKILIHQNQK